MQLTLKGQQRLKKLQHVEKLIKEAEAAKGSWNLVTASSKADEAKKIIEQEAVGILKDAIIVIDQFEQELANNDR